MPKTKDKVSASLRWQVFARDGFRCRYCGSEAGAQSTVLHADHVVSRSDGGETTMDNLVAACQRCNGGKSARSLVDAPGSRAAIDHAQQETVTLKEQSAAITACLAARRDLENSVYDMLCHVYGKKNVNLSDQAMSLYTGFVRQYGASMVLDWIEAAGRRRVTCWQSIQYVCGIARRHRDNAAN